MAEKDIIFSSKIKYTGIFSLKDLYLFCYDWLKEETDLILSEKKYKEKIVGDTKNVEIIWEGERKVTDYFKFEIKVEFMILGMKKVEINQAGRKISANQGQIEIKVKGTLIRDYEGKFEKSSTQKFWRSIYEKWIIPSRIEQFESKLTEDCDEFLSQTKAFLDLEARR